MASYGSTLLCLLCLAAAAVANPPPPAGWEDSGFLMAYTLEPAFHLERFAESTSGFSTILYGGPFLMYTTGDSLPRWGGGLSLGAEFRKYLQEAGSGSFAGMYTGYGIQLYDGGKNDDGLEQAVSVGPKAGYRFPLGTGADLEPYLAMGVRCLPGIDFAAYLGLKVALFPAE
ncbi:MAG: hypothetical protein R6U36_02490 [Candidatus Fermentibacteraceae bacterium]